MESGAEVVETHGHLPLVDSMLHDVLIGAMPLRYDTRITCKSQCSGGQGFFDRDSIDALPLEKGTNEG